MAQPIGLVEQFLFSHWRGRGSIKPENIVSDFGSGGAIYQKMLEGQGQGFHLTANFPDRGYRLNGGHNRG